MCGGAARAAAAPEQAAKSARERAPPRALERPNERMGGPCGLPVFPESERKRLGVLLAPPMSFMARHARPQVWGAGPHTCRSEHAGRRAPLVIRDPPYALLLVAFERQNAFGPANDPFTAALPG